MTEPLTQRLTAHVEPSLAAAIAARAEAEGRKVSQQVRVAVLAHLATASKSSARTEAGAGEHDRGAEVLDAE